MRKEITYKELLLNVLQDKEVPKEVYYWGNKYIFSKNTKEYYSREINKTLSNNFNYFNLAYNETIVLTYYEDILDKQEKEYLKAVIKPFRNIVNYIEKRNRDNEDWIFINIKNDFPIILPVFKANTMYKNMLVSKKYSLEELGL